MPFGEILGSYHDTWHNFAELYIMHHWTSHQKPGRKAPLSPVTKERKNLTLDLTNSCNFQQPWFTWQKSTLPPPVTEERKNLTLDLSISCNFQQLWFTWQKSPPPLLFYLFVRDLAHVTHVEYPWSPYYKSILRLLLSKYLLYVTNFLNLSKYSHIEKYRT